MIDILSERFFHWLPISVPIPKHFLEDPVTPTMLWYPKRDTTVFYMLDRGTNNLFFLNVFCTSNNYIVASALQSIKTDSTKMPFFVMTLYYKSHCSDVGQAILAIVLFQLNIPNKANE